MRGIAFVLLLSCMIGNAGAASMERFQSYLRTTQAARGDFEQKVYDKGGKRYPLIFNNKKLDFLAFWHKPHYAIVEVGIVNPVYSEPGRAPRLPTIDESKSHVYVKMIRDLGDRRKNSAYIGIGSTIIFAVLCWLLHKRDRLAAANRAAKAADSHLVVACQPRGSRRHHTVPRQSGEHQQRETRGQCEAVADVAECITDGGHRQRSHRGSEGGEDRKSTRLNSSHVALSRMPSSA